jgi:hypothetical protein
VIPAEAFHIAQIQEAQTKAPVPVVVGQTPKPLRYLIVLGITPSDVPIAGLADPE